MIEVKNVTKYHSGRPVLENISFRVPGGTNLGLIGPGGSGKTLLLKIICGLVEPDEGNSFIKGQQVQGLGLAELTKLRFDIGLLFQNYALFDYLNVTDNIAFPLRQAGKHSEEEILKMVQESLNKVDLPHIGHQYPNELSGGMKKRVGFARAVIPQPPIVLYDDPTAGLDPVTSSKIFLFLKAMKEERGVTSITISHDIEGIKDICDNFVLINRGRVVFYGSREEIENEKMPLVRQFWQGFSADTLG